MPARISFAVASCAEAEPEDGYDAAFAIGWTPCVGVILGDEGINIGGMQVARSEKSGSALAVISVDTRLPQAVAARIAEAVGAESFSVIDL